MEEELDVYGNPLNKKREQDDGSDLGEVSAGDPAVAAAAEIRMIDPNEKPKSQIEQDIEGIMSRDIGVTDMNAYLRDNLAKMGHAPDEIDAALAPNPELQAMQKQLAQLPQEPERSGGPNADISSVDEGFAAVGGATTGSVDSKYGVEAPYKDIDPGFAGVSNATVTGSGYEFNQDPTLLDKGIVGGKDFSNIDLSGVDFSKLRNFGDDGQSYGSNVSCPTASVGVATDVSMAKA